jgi:glycosyltransferase involved in cell wall biosynthesis
MGELINETITTIPYKPVSNSVDTTLFYPENIKADPTRQFEFVHVSTLSYQKNTEGLLRVIERYAATHTNVHFTFVGPASTELVDIIFKSPILTKSITLTGALPYNLVAEQMRKAHSLIMFSRYENQPCVILEALCCGLPIISTNVGGIAEVINRENGILIESEKEDQLFDAIETMRNSYSSFNIQYIAALIVSAIPLYSSSLCHSLVLQIFKQHIF